jgi:AraC-like DNA-binding protein
MQTRLIANNLDDLVFSHHLPPMLAAFTFEGTTPLVASASFGHVLLQEKPCNGITIHLWHFLLNQGCDLTIVREQPVLRLQFQLTNQVQCEPDGLPPLSFYEHGYNLLYIPTERSRIHFETEGIYSCLEIHYAEATLIKLQNSFPSMNHFLRKVERQQPALMMPVNQLASHAMLEVLNRLVQALNKTTDKSWLRTRAVEVLAQCLEDYAQHPLLEAVRLPFKDAGLIYHARHILQEQYAQHWTMKKLSLKTGLNYYKLENGFRQLYRQSPMDYLKDLRMEKAWLLLPGKRYSVAQVAEMTGYTNLSAFSKAFKKYFRITPRERSKEE